MKLYLHTADAESTAAAVETAGCSNLIHYLYLESVKGLVEPPVTSLTMQQASEASAMAR